MKAMILAAGLGTRLRPLTDNIPKALVEVNGKPLLEIIIYRLIKFGFEDIIINVHHLAEKIFEFLDRKNFGAEVTISDETDKLLDTGGGLKKASWFFDNKKPFLVHNVDVLTDLDLKALYDFHCNSDALATLAVKDRHSNRFFLFDKDDLLCGWRNTQTKEEIISRETTSSLKSFPFSCIQVLKPDIFSHIREEGKFSMTGVYIRLAKDHKIKGYVHNESLWIDIGKKETLPEAGRILQKIEDS